MIRNSNKKPHIRSQQIKHKNWGGCVSLRHANSTALSLEDWATVLSDLINLDDVYETILKKDGSSRVAVRRFKFGDHVIDAVTKQHVSKKQRLFIAGLIPSKAKRNFSIARKLYEKQIPVVYPLAAFYKNTLFEDDSIYINEYLPGSMDLYHFIKDHSTLLRTDLKVKHFLADQVADLFYMLEKAGFWHRDAKAQNFLVHKDSKEVFMLRLLDMDGIKRSFVNDYQHTVRGFARLAASTFGFQCITVKDYLRVLKKYCRLKKKNNAMRKVLFYDIKRYAVAVRLSTMINAAIEQEA